MKASDLLAAARGFSTGFWGLLLILLVMLGALSIRLPLLLQMPGHTVGLVIVLLGALHFRHTLPDERSWRRLSRLFLSMVILQLYLVPFLGWWRVSITGWYATLNLILFLVGGLLVLVLVARLALQMAVSLNDPTLCIEARLSLWSIPFLAGISLALIALRAGRFGLFGDPVFALQHLLVWPRPATLYPAALPFVPALAMAWEIKQRCLRELEPDADPQAK